MTPITAKAGDAIRIEKQLTEGSGRDGTPVDLTGETVRVYVQFGEDALVANQEVEYVDRTTGKIAVELQPSQTSNIGRHNIEWVLNPQDDPTTYPSERYDTLRTESPLDRDLTPSAETPPDLTVTTLTVEDDVVLNGGDLTGVGAFEASSAAVGSAPTNSTDVARKAETDALDANKADLTSPDGVLQSSQVPDLSITETFTVVDQAARLSLNVQEGDVAIQTNNNTTYIFTGGDPSVNSNWSKIQLDVLEAIDGSDITPSSVTTPSVETEEMQHEYQDGTDIADARSINTVYQNTSGTAQWVVVRLVATANDTTVNAFLSVSDTQSGAGDSVNDLDAVEDVTLSNGQRAGPFLSALVPDSYYYQIRAFGDTADYEIDRLIERNWTQP